MTDPIRAAALVVAALAASPAVAQDPAGLVRSFYATVDDPASPVTDLGAFFADGFRDNDRPEAAPAELSDKDAALGLFTDLRAGFPDGRHALDILANIEGDRAMVYWTFTGRHDGPFFGIPASGRDVSINGVDVFRVQDGRFVEQWHVEELMALFAQVSDG